MPMRCVEAGASGSGRCEKTLLALDVGTTNTKALLVGLPEMEVLATATRAVEIGFPHPGWVEQDALQMWSATEAAIAECLARARSLGVTICGITISNQRESVIMWDRRTGLPVGPVLGWQDTRTEDLCQRLRERGLAEMIHDRTGLALDPMFSAPKMSWLLEDAQSRNIDVGHAFIGTVDSWIGYCLTGQFFTEPGNASRTLLYDIHRLERTPELLEVFGIPDRVLAPVMRSNADFAVTDGRGSVPQGIPVIAVMADSHAAMYLQSDGELGHAKVTYGTGSSVMVLVDSDAVVGNGVATTVAWVSDSPVYGREGNIIATGAAIQWMANLLFAGSPSKLDRAAASVTDAGAIQFVPAFAGLGAPYFDRKAVGLIEGITGGTDAPHLALAVLEAVAQQVTDVLEAITDDGSVRIDVLHADGGATASLPLMQLQAGLVMRPVVVSREPAASALGAALMGARKIYREGNVAAGAGCVVSPTLSAKERDAMRHKWKHAIQRARTKADEGGGD